MYTLLFLFFVHILAIVVWSLMAYISETKIMRNLNIACSVIWGLCAIGDIVEMNSGIQSSLRGNYGVS